MNVRFKNFLFQPALVAVMGLVFAGRGTAQTFATLHSFNGQSDGASPGAGLILLGDTLYGTAENGGDSTNGTVFSININGTGFAARHSFPALDTATQTTNSDGANPLAGLISSGGILYGTAQNGGSSGNGTVFKLNTNGGGFENLYSFTNGSDGANPNTGLVMSGNLLYGTASSGGDSGYGTVFKLNLDGTGFTTLYAFTNGSDGATPNAGLVLAGNVLYGTASSGGASSNGTVFKLNLEDSSFATLHDFTNDIDGSQPNALILSGNALYGTAYAGGSWGVGTIFSINTNGAGFTVLHGFADSDGSYPSAGLMLSGNTLYGTVGFGGNYGNGTVFSINADGSGFTTLYHFSALDTATQTTNSDGANPSASLILAGNTLYGTASAGGISGAGTVFNLTLPGPLQLTVTPAGANVVLSWPTNFFGCALQSATNLVSPVSWTSVYQNSPFNISTIAFGLNSPVVVNGMNTETNYISGSQQFFRLVQPAGLVPVPAGDFTMGDSSDGESDAVPVSVNVSTFLMDENLVTYSQWQSVYNWATNHGYVFDNNTASGKAANHPVQGTSWFDAVIWCNARSELTGLTPVYCTDAGNTIVWKGGGSHFFNVNWSANGFRLPTEAEWEKAARGGLDGQRFPWSNVISESLANYIGEPGIYTNYDSGPGGYNAAFKNGSQPWTSPVGSFAPNRYGLSDMAGNVSEWCWDIYAATYAGGTDPHGPASGDTRIYRGGGWDTEAPWLSCGRRAKVAATTVATDLGFRCVIAH